MFFVKVQKLSRFIEQQVVILKLFQYFMRINSPIKKIEWKRSVLETQILHVTEENQR